jgi:acid phosphatase type 7
MRPGVKDELPRARFAVAATIAVVAAGISVAAIPSSDTRRAPKILAVRAKADAYVTAARHEANFAHTPRLTVDGRPVTRVYLRFLPGKVEGPVRRVSLLVYTQSSSRLGYQVRLATRPWSERTITFENAPRPSTRFVPSGRVRVGAWKAVGVTSLVGSLEQDISFALTAVGTRAIILASRESGLYAPRLVIEYEEPMTTSLPTDSSPSNWP